MKIRNKKCITKRPKKWWYLKIRPVLNNIFITITTVKGNVIVARNAGSCGFKGTQKRSSFIASKVLLNVINDFKKLKGTSKKRFIVQIFKSLRHHSVQSIMNELARSKGLKVRYIEFIGNRAHNGVRKPKLRRL